MSDSRHRTIEQLDFFSEFEQLGDNVWNLVVTWDPFVKSTVGRQLVRAFDSIGANLAEGGARYSDREALQFFTIARASARESRLWIERAIRRRVIAEDEGRLLLESLDGASKKLNGLITYRRQNLHSTSRESISEYCL